LIVHDEEITSNITKTVISDTLKHMMWAMKTSKRCFRPELSNFKKLKAAKVAQMEPWTLLFNEQIGFHYKHDIK